MSLGFWSHQRPAVIHRPPDAASALWSRQRDLRRAIIWLRRRRLDVSCIIWYRRRRLVVSCIMWYRRRRLDVAFIMWYRRRRLEVFCIMWYRRRRLDVAFIMWWRRRQGWWWWHRRPQWLRCGSSRCGGRPSFAECFWCGARRIVWLPWC